MKKEYRLNENKKLNTFNNSNSCYIVLLAGLIIYNNTQDSNNIDYNSTDTSGNNNSNGISNSNSSYSSSSGSSDSSTR